MKKISEGKKMWIAVMLIFLAYATIFIIFDDYDRKRFHPFNMAEDWHLVTFSIAAMTVLGLILLRFARQMDRRISREQAEQQALMRRELTQNIAHELKTPVASILGYTDTLLDNPQIGPEQRQHFLVRTNFQARRLTALLTDLSTLNRMDFATDMIHIERVNVDSIVADIIAESEFEINNRNQTYKNYLPEDIIIEGNKQLIYTIFRNLTDNALHYAGDGASVEITARNEGDQWRFTFADNGVGISEEHLPRLFERFYRVDKGRSRAMGGTGLGLAIVKNSVNFHGGQISASCPPNGGVQFQFTLKIKHNRAPEANQTR